MSEGAGNYSFYNHNLQRPTIPANRLVTRQRSDNALSTFESLSILSPSTDSKNEQFSGEPIVSAFVPHPPSIPKSKSSSHVTPIRFRGKKRSRNESPRTSGSEDERSILKQAVASNIPLLLASHKRSYNDGGSLSDPEFQRRRHFRNLEPLKGITSGKELVNNFKNYQHNVKSEARTSEQSHPLKVMHDLNGNKELIEMGQESSSSKPDTQSDTEQSNDIKIDKHSPLSDDSFTNVSDSEDDNTLSFSSDSDEELRKRSEEIAHTLLLSKRYPNATLPSIPKDISSSGTGQYETMDANVSVQNSNTYESVTGFQKIVDDQSNNEIRSQQCQYVSDTELSRQGDSEFSYTSQSSVLPRVHARTVRLRNTNFLEEELNQYFPDRKVGVFVATWNMHEEKVIPGYLDDFLLPEAVDLLPDIYVVGLQESTSLRKEWEIKLQETLGPSHVLMYSCSFGVLHLAVFVRRELVWFCSAVNQNSVATRPGHMIKTKGGLGVSFSLFGTSFLFINSHLTSDEGKSKDRINDYNIICKSLALQAVEKPWTDNRPDVTDRFDRVFWLGDFNFRVDMTRAEVDLLLEQNKHDFQVMRSHDQLTNLMSKGEVFKGFTEPDVNFPPTYKYDLNSDTYDSSSKSRVPSWTDRILYKSPENDSIKTTCYNACSSVLMSDHRPVYGIYEVTLKPCKKSVPLNGGQFVRDVYIEANRRRATVNQRNQQDSSVCTIL